MRSRLIVPIAWLLLAFVVADCDSPLKSPPISAVPAMAPDGSHVIVGFPDALSGLILPNQVNVSQGDGVTLDVDGVAIDSLSETLLTIHVRQRYDWRQQLTIRISGLVYERGSNVSESPLLLSAAPGLQYTRDIAPLFSVKCNSCHNAGLASGNYSTDSQGALYAFGSDSLGMNRSANLIPGNDRCQLVVKTSPRGREFRRAGLSFYEAELVRQWILYGDAADLPISGSGNVIAAQVTDFTHLRVAFPARPDPADGEKPERYHLEDLDEPGLTPIPAEAVLDSDLGETVRLGVPQLKLFHQYRVRVTRINDRFGKPLFDSASTDFRALLSYTGDIAPILERSCTRCHAPNVPDSLRGSYLTDSYQALYAFGSDSTADVRSRNLVPTDSACLLVTKVRQSGGRTGKCALRARLTPMESHRIIDWAVSFYARQN